MNISHLAASIAESPTLKLNAEARRLREQGEPVIHLGAGEPKSKVPADAIRAANALLATGEVRYTPTDGILELKQAIVGYTRENYGREVAPENVIVSGGAKQSISVALAAILDPGDEVIILAPYWVSYPEMVKLAFAVPVIVEPEAGSFVPRFEQIERAVTSRTKAILVNSPNNPSGAVYPADLIGALVEMCERKDIFLIMDDIYHKLVFDGPGFTSCYQFARKDLDDSPLVVVNGVSKLYAMTGFRIGWAVTGRKLRKVMANVQGQTTSCPSTVSQHAAVGALTGSQSDVDSLRQYLRSNRDIICRELETLPGVRLVKPHGTFYCLPDFSAYNRNSLELCDFLLQKARVVTVPGREFGLEGHLRLSYCGSVKDITEGVARIRWGLDPNSPKELLIGDKHLVRDWL